MARYRKKSLSLEEEVAAAVTSVAVGATVGAAVWYVALILLSRDEMKPKEIPASSPRALPHGKAVDAPSEV